MEVLTTILMVIQALSGVALIVVIALQSGKSDGLSGAIGGGSSETFLGKGKSKSRDEVLANITKWLGGGFVLLTFILNLL